MKSIMEQLSADQNINSHFRQVIAGEEPVGRMVTPHKSSQFVLDSAASVLAQTPRQLELLQLCYDLGRADGAIESTKYALELAK